ASGSVDNTVVLWDVARSQPLAQTLTGHTAAVYTLAFRPNPLAGASSQILASAGSDFTLRLWDVSTGKPPGPPLTGHASLVTDVAFSPDGQILASSSDDRSLLLWETQTRQLLGPLLKNHPHPLSNLAVSPGSYQGAAGPILAASDENGNVMLWNLTARQSLGPPLPIKGKPVVFSPDGRFLAGAQGVNINVWDMVANQPLASLKGHLDMIRSLAFSPKGQVLASGGDDKTIILWDVATRQPLTQPLLDHTAQVLSLAFSPDGRLLASGSEDGRVMLWDVPDGLDAGSTPPRLLGRPLVNGDRAWRLAFSPDGRLLASAGRNDGAIMLWQVNPEAWPGRACQIVGRNLTLAEWQRYAGHQPYR
ncbi:MAG: WD40 repeat domain-containing protein, partial [Chloroflexota bacterium]